VKYVPAILILLGFVILMAGPGRRGIRTGEQIGLVILGFIVLAALFAFVVNRSL
jgi:NADH:ubiquinone oxidoreductase subunit 6 (subunit J)